MINFCCGGEFFCGNKVPWERCLHWLEPYMYYSLWSLQLTLFSWDFDAKATWSFFETVHGKGLVNGVVAEVKWAVSGVPFYRIRRSWILSSFPESMQENLLAMDLTSYMWDHHSCSKKSKGECRGGCKWPLIMPLFGFPWSPQLRTLSMLENSSKHAWNGLGTRSLSSQQFNIVKWIWFCPWWSLLSLL